MADYIEREALLELYADAPGMKFDMLSVPIPVVRQNIVDMPAADVAPVVHGRWIEKRERDTFRGYVYHYQCSQCGRVENRKELYCPNCGAKMDGGDDE